MHKILSVLVGLACTTCTSTSSQNLTSNWSALRDVGKVDCAAWPLREGELAVEHLSLVDGVPPSFVAEIRMRNQTRGVAHAVYAASSQIDADDIQAVVLSAGAKVLAGAQFGEKKLIAVAQQKNDKTLLDLRQFPQNVVAYSGVQFAQPLAAARLIGGTAGLWLTFKPADSGRSVEETPAQVIFMKPGVKGGLQRQDFKVSFNDFPAVLPKAGTGEAVALWHDTSDGAPKFKVAKLREDGSMSAVAVLAVPVNHAVESWSAVAAGAHSFLAYVDGDSMVGQASIKIAKISWDENLPVVNWVRTRSLSDIHVGDPVWVAAADKAAYVLIPQWVDEENTVASYRVGPDDIEGMAVSGVFPKGTRVESGFYDAKKSRVYAFLRQKASVGWRYDLCHLKDLAD